MKTWHVLLPLLVLGAGSFYVRQQQKQRTEIEQLQKQIAALASSLSDAQELVTRRLAAQSLLQGPAPQALPEAPAAAVATGRQPASAPPNAAPRKEPQPAEMAAHMDAVFSRETADANWSAKTQQATQEKIHALMPKDATLLSMDCRTSMCRVEMSYPSVDDYHSFVRSAFMDVQTHVWDGPGFTTLLENAGSGVVAVSFLAREGQSLPQMPE